MSKLGAYSVPSRHQSNGLHISTWNILISRNIIILVQSCIFGIFLVVYFIQAILKMRDSNQELKCKNNCSYKPLIIFIFFVELYYFIFYWSSKIGVMLCYVSGSVDVIVELNSKSKKNYYNKQNHNASCNHI